MVFSRKGGAVIFIVVVLGMTLMAFAVVMLSDTGISKERIFERKEKMQSLYIAKGGQQHMLLKIRLLPTPFYDAVAYAIGKNPYFDFTENECDGNKGIMVDPLVNPGPLFFTGNATATVLTCADRPQARLLQENTLSRSGNWWLTSDDQEFKGPMSVHLRKFLEDIRTDYNPDGDTALPKHVVVNSAAAGTDFAMGGGWSDPFSASYQVDRVFIFGSTGRFNYATDSIMIATRGEVVREGQKSIILNENFESLSSGTPRNLTRVYLRSTQAGSGYDGMTNVSNIDKFEFSDAGGFDNFLSEKHVEVVTGIYEVRRKGD
jgi:hypothetical protein